MPRLSIIVPVYKVEQYIHKCVESILAQGFKDFELLLVDDGSPDNCGKICDEYAQKDERIRVIHKENGGLSDARNFGIEAAKGEVLSFIDSDDYIDSHMYEEMLEYMDKHDLDVVCADVYIVRGEKLKFKPRYNEDKIFVDKEAINEILDGSLDNSACNKIYKRSVVADVRYPKGRVYEDVATTYKIIFNSKRVGYMCKPYYYYIKRESSIVASSFNSKSRYDQFLGYKERLSFAEANELESAEVCRKHAVSTALSTLTAFYANGEDEASERFKDVKGFIDANYNKLKVKLRGKDRMLLKGAFVHKLYAKLSGMAKKAKGC